MRPLILALVLLPSLAVAAEDPDAAPAELEGIASPEEGEAPDGTVAAVQERSFRLKHELGLGVGYLPSDPFSRGVALQLGYTFHFTDHFAWQVGRGFFNFSFPTNLRDQLVQRYHAEPRDFDTVQWAVGSDLIFAPFYGKAALLNRSVLWWEIYVLAGASTVKLASALTPAVNIGGGIRLFGTRWLSLRLEAVNHFTLPAKRISILDVQLAAGLSFGAGS